ncbi:MAG: helix-turn-helix transcriptional regulator [Candidatus Saganbacteria bacterium]|nr:helix-turn-helix transcriptional regulator [Candidatus Saganbacteria bacterium]
MGQRIASLRRQKGLTIEKLAYENDLAKGNLSEIEKGAIDPKLSTLERIADGLEVTLKELFNF